MHVSDGTDECDALILSAGQCVRLASMEWREPEFVGSASHPCVEFSRGNVRRQSRRQWR